MALIISANGQYQKQFEPKGFEVRSLESLEEVRELVRSSDWSPSIFKDGYRGNENFLESWTLACDIDNTTEHQMSLEEFQKEFGRFEYWVMTSKSHQKEKKVGKKGISPPADRYHVAFPLAVPFKAPGDYTAAMEAMILKYPCIDKGAKDGARFFFAASATDVFYNAGVPLEIPAPAKKKGNLEGVKMDFRSDEERRREETYELLKQAASQGAFDDRTAWIDIGCAMRGNGYFF